MRDVRAALQLAWQVLQRDGIRPLLGVAYTAGEIADIADALDERVVVRRRGSSVDWSSAPMARGYAPRRPGGDWRELGVVLATASEAASVGAEYFGDDAEVVVVRAPIEAWEEVT